MIEHVAKILPTEIGRLLFLQDNKEEITEIRLRTEGKLRVYFGKKEKVFDIKVRKEDLLKILNNISSNSIYSVQNDINKGYITIEGGNRIGIAGEVVVTQGKIKNIKDISSMNIRIAKEYVGVSDKIMNNIVEAGIVRNTLIVSPPGLGKTTLLRDIIRNLSELGYNISVIDERGEIASMYQGKATLDIGARTDVISFVDKAFGMQMAVRSMAPDIVCTDEIGNAQDVEAIKYLCKCGVKYITTMHGNSLKDITEGPMREIIHNGYLDNVIVLSGKNGIGSIEKVYTNLKCKEGVKC